MEFAIFLTVLLSSLWGANEATIVDAQLQECTSTVTVITLNSGEIFSPNYPNNFPANSDCLWRIEVDQGMHVTISFENDEVDIPDYEYYDTDMSCKSDYLRLYDGPSDNDTLIFEKSLCGPTINVRPVISSSHVILVHFVSDFTYHGTGFKLIWNATEKCGDNEYRCHNGKCIADSFVCDDIDQCGDASDEWKCSYPSSTKCGQQSIAPNFKWSSRIVGGNIVVPGSWPWTVSIYINGNPECGGTLITKKWILTAAHCAETFSVDSLLAVVGAHNVKDKTEPYQKKIAILSKIVHNKYASFDLPRGYDIALLELAEDVTYSERVHNICWDHTNVDEPSANESCVVMGWGRQADSQVVSDELRQVVVNVYSDSYCEDYWRTEDSQTGTYTNNLFCSGLETGGGDSCQGDSGGPLVCLRGQQWHQFGVVSYGQGCASKGHPGFYTRISSFKEWMENAPCEINVSGCNVNARCRLVSGVATCTCRDGYEGSGVGANGCADINECEVGTGNCTLGRICLNTIGSYQCGCGDGYTANDAGDCIDINECEGTFNCPDNRICVNNFGGYTCGCKPGFEGSSCQDIDECLDTSLTSCTRANTECKNTVGSYICECAGGFFENSESVCVDVNECSECEGTPYCSVCKLNSNCTNTIGSHTCMCIAGYVDDDTGTACLKIYKREVTLTDNYTFSTNLLIKETNDFDTMSKTVTDAVRGQYHRLDIKDVTVDKFIKGSVIAIVLITFSDPSLRVEDVENARDDSVAINVIKSIVSDQCNSNSICKNGAECSPGESMPSCTCTNLHEGNTCENISSLFIVTIVVSAVAFLFLILSIIFICLYCSARRQK